MNNTHKRVGYLYRKWKGDGPCSLCKWTDVQHTVTIYKMQVYAIVHSKFTSFTTFSHFNRKSLQIRNRKLRNEHAQQVKMYTGLCRNVWSPWWESSLLMCDIWNSCVTWRYAPRHWLKGLDISEGDSPQSESDKFPSCISLLIQVFPYPSL